MTLQNQLNKLERLAIENIKLYNLTRLSYSTLKESIEDYKSYVRNTDALGKNLIANHYEEILTEYQRIIEK
jgi:hypothetical protein